MVEPFTLPMHCQHLSPGLIITAAYFVLLGMLAMTATLDPLVAPLFPRKLAGTHFNLTICRIPVVLKVRWRALVCAQS